MLTAPSPVEAHARTADLILSALLHTGLAMLAALVISALIGASAGISGPDELDPIEKPIGTFLLLGSMGAGYLLVALVLRRLLPAPNFRDAARSRRAVVGYGVLTGLLAIGFAAAYSPLGEALFGPEREQDWARQLAAGGGMGFALLATFAVGWAPITEEWFFRGHLFRWLHSRGSRGLAYLLTALLFAACHMHPPAIIDYLGYAFLFAWGYERTRSLTTPVIAHIMVNACGVVQLRLLAGG